MRTGASASGPASGAAAAPRPTDIEFLGTLLDAGLERIVTVPCSITDTWHAWALDAARHNRVRVTPTTHEGNAVGIAAGTWFGSGRPSLIHLQNSGLPNAGDGLISFAAPDVYGIPLLTLVTWRGLGADRSEPHLSIGRRTADLTEAIFGTDAVFGAADGAGLLDAAASAWRATQHGSMAALRVADGSFSRTFDLGAVPTPDPVHLTATPESAHPADATTLPAWLQAELDAGTGGRTTRDAAIAAIVDAHPGAAILFCNGYTSRAAQSVADRPGNFYNAGYMGGTLAIGWGLAVERPELEVVVVDGDQNAMMSTMTGQLAADFPPNLRWYVLDNHIGASVGIMPSTPLSPAVRELARIVPTIPDVAGAFAHPRVSTRGAYGAFAEAQTPHTLTGLAAGFRAWLGGSAD